MLNHIITFACGFVLDQLLGDPYWLPHPIRLMGRLIGFLDQKLLGTELKEPRDKKAERRKGVLLVVLVLAATVLLATVVLLLAYRIHPVAGLVVESVMCYQILAAKCLKVESMKVFRKLSEQDLPGARYAVSMIVGRDTDILDEAGVAKAAVETVAENASDGVIAPMLFLAIGGPVLGFFYKAVNTMDSMVGYKNDRYLDFGRAAAKLDDVLNFLPSRICALLFVAVSFFSGKEYDAGGAYRIFKRDRFQHASPNSAQTEAACAGALGIRLAGDASYFGKIVKKPYIGDALRQVEYEDIRRANHLMYGSAYLCEIICLIVMAVIYYV